MSVLSAPHFHNEEAAYQYVEERLWPNGPVCPHCGGVERIGKMGGKSTRIGTYKCYQCRKPFTVKVGTIFESSHVSMRHWLQAMYLMASSKKGISANQIHRLLGCTLKTGWFIEHRLREAMRDGELAPFGGGGGIVEMDETFWGRDPDALPRKMAIRTMNAVLTLVERGGRTRSIVMPVDNLNAAEIAAILTANVSREARLMTDEGRHYAPAGKLQADHQTVAHGRGEYVRRQEPEVHSNTVEGFYSIFKRGMRGVYQHCSKKHLHRYAAEFDFRYSNRVALGVDDVARADIMLAGVVGRRPTYRLPDGTQ
ncbi:MAG TPA: IS1595 family transposase [Caulobacteraceae bacterium]|nr:IS1595 family transposase [Caulobacteraceae bacterium]